MSKRGLRHFHGSTIYLPSLKGCKVLGLSSHGKVTTIYGGLCIIVLLNRSFVKSFGLVCLIKFTVLAFTAAKIYTVGYFFLL